MRLRIAAAFSMTVGILATTIAVVVPASAAPAAWVMPNVRGMVLSQAEKAVREAAGGTELNFYVADLKNGQDVHNKMNWEVCSQSPRAGNAISQKTKKVSLAVKRFNHKGCT